MQNVRVGTTKSKFFNDGEHELVNRYAEAHWPELIEQLANLPKSLWLPALQGRRADLQIMAALSRVDHVRAYHMPVAEYDYLVGMAREFAPGFDASDAELFAELRPALRAAVSTQKLVNAVTATASLFNLAAA
ncbi:hypothetical protein JFK97_20415 [Chromobacterium phragmitis]|uniref:hypothetical protein n=1 Tax=Chromobacterium amazonense TaxID=1382803 RepID=UPI0021B748FF|nr:hypothetical protein [Chromobacterium amazonense]MBM2886758.1 hypothetical protein [Chromobacterium amazonense]